MKLAFLHREKNTPRGGLALGSRWRREARPISGFARRETPRHYAIGFSSDSPRPGLHRGQRDGYELRTFWFGPFYTSRGCQQ